MKLFGLWLALFIVIACLPAVGEPLSMEKVNTADYTPESGDSPALVIKVQVLLDRRRYSPGVIDGRSGETTRNALKAFQADNGLDVTGRLDEATFEKLADGSEAPVLTHYTIEAADVRGPFTEKLPDRIADMAKLDRMAFTGPRELLAERFHISEDLLARLNPGVDFTGKGSRIVVTEVETMAEGRAAAEDANTAGRLVVDKSEGTLRVLTKDGEPLAFYPATVGSKNNPAPDGETKIVRIARGPTWNYDPRLELEGQKDRPDEPVTVAAGPNNPVGTVWIALDRDRYGIHGTANPEEIGKSVSSGCVRLTNWDVEELAKLARKGMPVLFED